MAMLKSGTVGDSKPTVRQTLVFEESRGNFLHVIRDQEDQGEEENGNPKMRRAHSISGAVWFHGFYLLLEKLNAANAKDLHVTSSCAVAHLDLVRADLQTHDCKGESRTIQ